MKKFIPLIALVACGVSAPAFAHGNSHDGWVNHMFREADTNKDGYIDKDEYLIYAQAKFDKMDTDGDGKLSKSEVIAHRKQEMARHGHMANNSSSPNRPDSTGAGADRPDTSNEAKTNADSSSNR